MENKINEQCSKCAKDCKQSRYTTIEYCPLFEEKSEKAVPDPTEGEKYSIRANLERLGLLD